MKTVGIICEYNPFHNGHAYQIREAKRRSGADTVVCVMSGNYVQRGEAAILDKWTRASLAVGQGADLVIELPTLWASGTAQLFAEGAMALLREMEVDGISCGVEEESAEDLMQIARILGEETPFFRNILLEEMKKGNSFPKSRETAAAAELKRRGMDPELAGLLHGSNNILAIEYMRAAQKMGWQVPFYPIRRKGAQHNSAEEKDGMLSASRIREILSGKDRPVENWLEEAERAVPSAVWRVLQQKKEEGKLHPAAECMKELLYYRVSMMKPEELKEIEGMGEGLENALIKACSSYQSWEEIICQMTASRYPSSRIRRILLNVCLGITRDMVSSWKGRIPYVKVLCFNEAGQTVLRRYREKASAALLTNPGREQKLLNEEEQAFLQQEARWSDLYELTGSDPSGFQRGTEFRRNAVKISK